MNAEEAKDELDKIEWVSYIAMISYGKYMALLQSPAAFNIISPGTELNDDLHIKFSANNELLLSTERKYVILDSNKNAFQAWQMVLGLMAMTSILDHYLKTVADRQTKKTNKSLGIFQRFEKLTSLPLSVAPDYSTLSKYHAIRDISVHNHTKVNQKFLSAVKDHSQPFEHYHFQLNELKIYGNAIKSSIDFIETWLAKKDEAL